MKMRTIIVSVLLGLFSTSAMALDKCMEGNWFPNKNDGTGIVLEVLEDQNLAVAHYYSWYGGRRDHYILTGKNDIDGAWAFNMYQSMISGAGEGYTQYVGTGSFTTIDDNTAIFEYEQLYQHLNVNNTMHWCIGCNYEMEYYRLTQPTACIEN